MRRLLLIVGLSVAAFGTIAAYKFNPPTPIVLTDGASIAVDASLGSVFTLTITGASHTISNPTNLATSQYLNFIITQNATGGFTPLWGTQYKFPYGTPTYNLTATTGVSVVTCASVSSTVLQCLTPGPLPNPSATTLGGIESYVAVTNQWINAISTAGVPSSTQPAFSNLSGALAQAQAPTGGSNLQFWQTNGSGTGAWASTPIQICGSSGVTAGAGGVVTDYVGIGALSSTQANVMFPSAIAGTATAVYIASAAAAGTGHTFTYTVMGGSTGGTAEALTCTISGSSQVACNDTAHTFTIAAGDLLSLRMVGTVTSAATQHMFCLKVTTP